MTQEELSTLRDYYSNNAEINQTNASNVDLVANNINDVITVATLEAEGKIDDIYTASANAVKLLNMTVSTGTEGSNAVWDNINGILTIPRGDTGATGNTGATGDSSYQVWLNQGNIGTEADYLLSLKGDTGDTGATGEQGIQGIAGYSINDVSSSKVGNTTTVTVSGTFPTSPYSFDVLDGADGLGSGDMSKTTYDTNATGIVDDSEKLGTQLPSYYLDYSNFTNTPSIPTALSSLTDDATHRLVSDAQISTWNSKSDFDGAYSSLTGTPTTVSSFTNDAGYLTSYSETDPIFTAWDKSTGISITESQISDFGSYEPSNANISKNNVSNTFTASQRGTVTTDNDLSFDLNTTNNFVCTPTATGTLTFTNITAGQSGNILLVNTTPQVISCASTTYISATDLTVINTAGTYWLSYYSDGTNVYVSASQALTSAGA